MTSRLPTLVVLVLTSTAGCRQDAITLAPTTVRDANGLALEQLERFHPLEVRVVPFFGDTEWLRVSGGASPGEVLGRDVALLPLPTRPRFIVPPRVDVERSATKRALPACTRVEGLVHRDADGVETFILVEGGRPVGIIPATATATTAPAAATFREATWAALRSLAVHEAERQAEAAVSCQPTDRDSRAILAELVGRQGEARRAELLRGQAPWPPLPTVATGSPVAVGDLAFVGDVGVVLRVGSGADDAVVQALPIGTSVRVVGLEPPLAKVATIAGDVVVDLGAPFADPPTPPPAPSDGALRAQAREGLVPLDALTRAVPSESALAAEAEKLGGTLEAVVLWRRAVALAPDRADLRRQLVDVALKAGRPVEAAQGAMASGAASATTARASLEPLFRCSGDVRRAAIKDGGAIDLDAAPGDLCARFDPRPPCLEQECDDGFDAPCDHDHEDHVDGEEEGPDLRPAAVIEAEAAAEAARAEAEEAAEAAARARDAAVEAAHVAGLVAEGEAVRARAEGLARVMPRGPLVRIGLRHVERLGDDVGLALARVVFAEPCNVNTVEVERVVPLPLPKPLPQGELVFMVDVDADAHHAVVKVPAGVAPEAAAADQANHLDVALVPGDAPDCSCPTHCF